MIIKLISKDKLFFAIKKEETDDDEIYYTSEILIKQEMNIESNNITKFIDLNGNFYYLTEKDNIYYCRNNSNSIITFNYLRDINQVISAYYLKINNSSDFSDIEKENALKLLSVLSKHDYFPLDLLFEKTDNLYQMYLYGFDPLEKDLNEIPDKKRTKGKQIIYDFEEYKKRK